MNQFGVLQKEQKSENQASIAIQTREASIQSLKSAKILQKSAILLKAINQVCKILIQKHEQEIKLIVKQEVIFKEDQKQRNIFLSTWKRICQSTYIKPNEHQKIIQLAAEIVRKKIKDIYESMTEDQYSNYRLIVEQNYKIIIKNTKKQARIQLTIDSMIQIDMLSVFLSKNLQIRRKYGKYFVSPLIPLSFITKIFYFKNNSLRQIMQKYGYFEQYITCNFKDKFEQILNFICLVELKKRYWSTIKRSGCIAQKMASNLQILFNQSQSKSESNEIFKYQLSEVIFLLKGNQIQPRRQSASTFVS